MLINEAPPNPEQEILEKREVWANYIEQNNGIDNGVKPILVQMNRLGLHTVESCEGHDNTKSLFITWLRSPRLSSETFSDEEIQQSLLTITAGNTIPEIMYFDRSNSPADGTYQGDSSHPYLAVHPFDFGVNWRPNPDGNPIYSEARNEILQVLQQYSQE